MHQWNEIYQAYFNYGQNGLALFRPSDDGTDFIILDINGRGAEICHLVTKDEVVGKLMTECFPGVISDGLFSNAQRAIKEGKIIEMPPHRYENTVLVLWLKTILVPLSGGGLAVIYEDLTQVMQAAELEREFMTRENFLLTSLLEDISEVNDVVTGGHIRRITTYATQLAIEQKLPQELLAGIRRYASLHDIGKVGLSSDLLTTGRTYTPQDREAMKQHVVIGGKVLQRHGFDRIGVNIARYHHERWDGRGYIDGLSGQEIPLEARVVSLVDHYDALITPRPYKQAFSREETERAIREASGTRFDPRLVATFWRIRDKFYEIFQKSQGTSSPSTRFVDFGGLGNGV